MTNRAPHPTRESLVERNPPELVVAAPRAQPSTSDAPDAASGGLGGAELMEQAPAAVKESVATPATRAVGPAASSEFGVAGLEELGVEPAAPTPSPRGEEAPGGTPVPGSAGSQPFPAPWVDEVPDPVTPYEQRVSETVKLADLPPVEQLRGRVLANRYLAEEVAEQSAASVSYRAYHLALDRAVTVRILPRGLACSDELCQEVRRVARVASELNHPHVASTLDFGVTSDGWPFLVTDHVQGRTLALLLAEEGKFVLRRVLHIGRQLAAGMHAAHQAGVVHGLLSPDNVLVTEPGSSAEVAKILGFGVASARGSAPTPPRSASFGVPFYVSPEQASCQPLDSRSDVYSMGALLYELMTGTPPFSDGDFAAVLCQHLDDEAPPPSSRLPSPGPLAKAMDAIVERCLRKDPEARFQSAAELGEELARLEAAAARNKRRPMPEIQRPPTTIHSPAPRADAHSAPGAKVIVHGDPAETPGTQARGSSPGAETLPARAPRRPPRVSVDQATIKISALDRELAMAMHGKANAPGTAQARSGGSAALRGLLAACVASLALFVSWLSRRAGSLVGGVQRLLGGTKPRGGSPGA